MHLAVREGKQPAPRHVWLPEDALVSLQICPRVPVHSDRWSMHRGGFKPSPTATHSPARDHAISRDARWLIIPLSIPLTRYATVLTVYLVIDRPPTRRDTFLKSRYHQFARSLAGPWNERLFRAAEVWNLAPITAKTDQRSRVSREQRSSLEQILSEGQPAK